MKAIFLIIISVALFTSTIWTEQVYALCAADINYDAKLKTSELVFTGTVTRLDNYDGPQRVTFFIHDVIKGEVDTPKHVLENPGTVFTENNTVGSSSVSVDYKIGKTYKVYVENGMTTSCTTKLTTPPADYVWEPGPEDGNYYSENPAYVDPCEEGYGLSDGICTPLEEMNKDLPTCNPNPKHDFGKCKKNMEEPDNKLQDVLDNCNCQKSGQACIEPEFRWWNATHFIDNIDCEYLDRDAFGAPPPEPEPEPDIPIPENCGPGTTLQNGICVTNSENDDTTTGDKWGGPLYEKLPPPNLEPIVDYDYGLIYVMVLLTVIIIGGIVGGIVFAVRRKRK